MTIDDFIWLLFGAFIGFWFGGVFFVVIFDKILGLEEDEENERFL